MMASEGEQLQLVAHYRQLVEAYEAVDTKIDELIMTNRRKSEDMSAADMRQYRKLANKRSELLNEMRLLERQLNLMEDDASALVEENSMVTGPSFEEMLHPQTIDPAIRAEALAALQADPLNPLNLYNITWRDPQNQVYHIVLPSELTGVDANIVLIYGMHFPSGSHKVGAAYSVLLEQQLLGEVDPNVHTLVWPSTGNYGIGGAFIGCRMEYDSIVVLPEEMSQERFDRITRYGARIIRTAGSESNVKEIYDEVKRLRGSDPKVRRTESVRGDGQLSLSLSRNRQYFGGVGGRTANGRHRRGQNFGLRFGDGKRRHYRRRRPAQASLARSQNHRPGADSMPRPCLTMVTAPMKSRASATSM